MKLEEQVVSLELAKQLKEADYPQEGLWSWYYSNSMWLTLTDDMVISRAREKYVAPTVSELGERLPELYLTQKINNRWRCLVSVGSKIGNAPLQLNTIRANTEVDARAKMWLYLKKKGLL